MGWTIKTSELRAPESGEPLDVRAVWCDEHGAIGIDIPRSVEQSYPDYDLPLERERAREAVKRAIERLHAALARL